jgi:hypothetical protein
MAVASNKNSKPTRYRISLPLVFQLAEYQFMDVFFFAIVTQYHNPVNNYLASKVLCEGSACRNYLVP